MRQVFTLLFLGTAALLLSSCHHCKTCYVGGPGDACKPCPQPPKPLKKPLPKSRCELPKWPERPVKCVTTQISRKCCKEECHVTEQGYEYTVEVCEITYKSLYTDGSSKVWTEVSRNPIVKSPSSLSNIGTRGNRTWKSKGPTRNSIVGDRCDECDQSVQAKIQHLDTNLERGISSTASALREDIGVAGADIRHGLQKLGTRAKPQGNNMYVPPSNY